MEGYLLDSHGTSAKEAIVQGEHYRISILTPALIRLEYSEKGIFEDHATQMVLNRDFTVPEFQVKDAEGGLLVCTEALELHYNRKKFTRAGLWVKVHGENSDGGIWHYGDEPKDLGGTARTLDGADGEIPLGSGVISRNGYSVLDDSRSMVLTEDGWVAPRPAGNTDMYFFGYGHRYLDCLRDFYHLCGKTPLLPKYALGNWWSRYHRYTEKEYKELIERFEAEQIPFSVAVVDMDWHLVDDVDPKYGSGWTGYTWNRKLFPDPKGFMDWLHGHGMKITLNVHPADGIRAYEEAYGRVATAMDMDPKEGKTVEFDPADPRFMEVYLKVLHHSLEEEGVDFWWLDWQQGTRTKIPGLDPLWMLNHYHFLDSGWKGRRRMTFSRYAGVGSHRYPVGFSGDTVVSWESLRFQPYFTNTASNIGYGWWSHDIGGHMNGIRDDELMARWTQLGVFSPVNRLHSTNNPFAGKEPWKFGRDTEYVMKEFLRLRHGLIPYLYTMNRRAAHEDLPIVMPLYYLEPLREEAYEARNEYYFGSELLVSPVTVKMDGEALAAGVQTWIPEGIWSDFFSGMIYHGGRMMELWRGIEGMPVLMKAGAIVPMKDMRCYDNSVENPKDMEVRIFPAAQGHFILWEDQGDTPVDEEGNWAYTELDIQGCAAASADDAGQDEISDIRFKIGAAQGNRAVIPGKRSWKLIFMGVCDAPVTVEADGIGLDAVSSYYNEQAKLVIQIPETAVDKEICVAFPEGLMLSDGNREMRCYKLLERAQMEYDVKVKAMELIQDQGERAVDGLAALGLGEAVLGELSEMLLA